MGPPSLQAILAGLGASFSSSFEGVGQGPSPRSPSSPQLRSAAALSTCTRWAHSEQAATPESPTSRESCSARQRLGWFLGSLQPPTANLFQLEIARCHPTGVDTTPQHVALSPPVLLLLLLRRSFAVSRQQIGRARGPHLYTALLSPSPQC